MQIIIDEIDSGPSELSDQTPIVADLVREMPGADRPDYWLAHLPKPIRWVDESVEREIHYLILAARSQGARIAPGMKDLGIGIAYVIDPSLVDDRKLAFEKCRYVAIGFASDSRSTTAD